MMMTRMITVISTRGCCVLLAYHRVGKHPYHYHTVMKLGTFIDSLVQEASEDSITRYHTTGLMVNRTVTVLQ